MKNTRSLRPSPTVLLDPKCDSSFKAMFAADTEDSNKALKDLTKDLQKVNEKLPCQIEWYGFFLYVFKNYLPIIV